MAVPSKQDAMAALDAALAGVGTNAAAPGPGGNTVDCQVCGYTIDAATGEPVAPVEEVVAPGGAPV